VAYDSDTFLAAEDFRGQFRASWDAAEVRYLKVERRQSYNQVGDASYERFARGDYGRASESLREALMGQEEMYRSARARGIRLVRLRLVELPLTDYLLRYEFPSYLVSQDELGEEILVATVGPEGRLDDLLPDCIIFDHTVMYVNTYDGCGRPAGAIRVDDAPTIDEHVGRAEALLEESLPLRRFMADHM
jgi:hypothetical protein